MINTGRYLCIIILFYLFLGFAYAMIVPIFEAPDEPDHLRYIQFLKEHHRLPSKSNFELGNRQNHQPPLYYFIQSLLLSMMKSDRVTSLPPATNPNFSNFTWPDNSSINLFIHTPEDLFSLDKDIIILRILRLVSLLPGVLIILITFKITTLIFPGDKSMGIYAAGITAFIPQFIFTSATINNDIMAALFSSIAIFRLLKFIKEASKRYLDIFLVGIFVGLGLLTKWTTLFLIPLSLIVLFSKYKVSRHFFVESSILIITVLIISGWTFLRVHFEPGALNAFFQGEYRLTLGFAFWHLFHSFWGWFGWGAFLFPKGWRIFYLIVVLFSTSGILSLLIFKNVKVKYSKLQLRLISMCLMAIIISVLLITGLSYTLGQAQGRYLFPAVSAISIFIIVGLKNVFENILSIFFHQINFVLPNLITALLFIIFLSNVHAFYLIFRLYYSA